MGKMDKMDKEEVVAKRAHRPLYPAVNRLRREFLARVRPEHIANIVEQLIDDAQHPDFTVRHPSRVELFNRIYGRKGAALDAGKIHGASNAAINLLAVVLANPDALRQANELANRLALQARPDSGHE